MWVPEHYRQHHIDNDYDDIDDINDYDDIFTLLRCTEAVSSDNWFGGTREAAPHLKAGGQYTHCSL